MDFISTFLLCLMSCVIGAILMLLIQYYAFVKYFDVPEETPEQKSINEKYLLPDVSIYLFFVYIYILAYIYLCSVFFGYLFKM